MRLSFFDGALHSPRPPGRRLARTIAKTNHKPIPRRRPRNHSRANGIPNRMANPPFLAPPRTNNLTPPPVVPKRRLGMPPREARRSGIASPTGTIHPRESRETEVRKRESKDSFRGMPCRIWNCGRTFSRDGTFRPRAGRGLHPRPERSTHAKAEKQKSESGNQKIHFGECLAAFGIAGEHSAGMELSGLEPVGGCTPDRNDPPTRKQRNRSQKAGIKRFISGNALPHLELRENIQPGWNFPASSRSGVAPPTGTIHPRESRETTDRK